METFSLNTQSEHNPMLGERSRDVFAMRMKNVFQLIHMYVLGLVVCKEREDSFKCVYMWLGATSSVAMNVTLSLSSSLYHFSSSCRAQREKEGAHTDKKRKALHTLTTQIHWQWQAHTHTHEHTHTPPHKKKE